MAAGKIWPIEDKVSEGGVMDGIDGSSFGHSDEEAKVPFRREVERFLEYISIIATDSSFANNTIIMYIFS
jgi:hypothetical protein